jgi:hypothetical protein
MPFIEPIEEAKDPDWYRSVFTMLLAQGCFTCGGVMNESEYNYFLDIRKHRIAMHLACTAQAHIIFEQASKEAVSMLYSLQVEKTYEDDDDSML